jgi:hypothetical protein
MKASIHPGVHDDFSGQKRHPHWNRLAFGASWVEENAGAQMIVSDAPAGSLSVAQIDDYVNRPRRHYLWQPPLRLKTRIRASHPAGELMGTAGIGFWNNMMPLWGTRLEVNPNWIWFYYASPQSTISLTSGPTSGWKASVVYGGKGGCVSMAVGDWLMKVPGFGKLMSGVRFPASEASLDSCDFTHWHELQIDWMPDWISFIVDGVEVLRAQLSLNVPLAFVTWLDNNYAALDPSGNFDIGNLAVLHKQVLELAYVDIQPIKNQV